MEYLTLIACIAFAYLLGSVPFGYILVKLFGNKDVRDVGSGGTGATNVVRAGGKLLGVITLILDASKGFAVAVISGILAFAASGEAHALADAYIIGMQVAVVLGHIYSVFLNFKGGKSFATFLGISIAYSFIVPHTIFVIALVWLVAFLITRISAMGALCSIIAANAYFAFAYKDFFWAYAICSLLVIYAHRSNIQRILSGTEHRFSFGKKDIT